MGVPPPPGIWSCRWSFAFLKLRCLFLPSRQWGYDELVCEILKVPVFVRRVESSLSQSVCCIKQKDWLCEDQRWTEDGQAWFYVLKLENELNTRLDWLVMRNLFSRSDISSNFSISFSISSNFSVLVPSAELPPKGKNCKYFAHISVSHAPQRV